MSTPFLRDVDAEILHACSTCPSRGQTSVFLLFIFADKNWAKVGHIFRKILTGEISGENKKKNLVRCSQGHVEDVCTISRSESKKRRGHSPGNSFGVFSVNNREWILICVGGMLIRRYIRP